MLVTILSALDTVSSAQAYQADRTNNLDDMRNVINRMTRELRQATAVTDCAATPDTITYTTYVNGVSTQIVYAASGTTLTRTVGSGTAFPALTHLVADTVDGKPDIFTCTSASGVTGVQWVDINLRVTPLRHPDTTLVLDSKVNLRNRTAALTGGS